MNERMPIHAIDMQNVIMNLPLFSSLEQSGTVYAKTHSIGCGSGRDGGEACE